MFWLMLAPALAGVTGASMDFYGAGAIQPDAPNLKGPARTIPMGCGGLGFTFANQKRKNTAGLRPESTTFQISLVDVCYGIGDNTSSYYIAPFNFGVGAQWGGSMLYLTAEANAGLGGYDEDHGPGSLSTFGVTGRARVAPAIHLGFVGIEVGPTLRALAPLYTEVNNAYPDGLYMKGIASFDVVFRFGTAAPNHQNHPFMR